MASDLDSRGRYYCTLVVYLYGASLVCFYSKFCCLAANRKKKVVFKNLNSIKELLKRFKAPDSTAKTSTINDAFKIIRVNCSSINQ